VSPGARSLKGRRRVGSWSTIALASIPAVSPVRSSATPLLRPLGELYEDAPGVRRWARKRGIHQGRLRPPHGPRESQWPVNGRKLCVLCARTVVRPGRGALGACGRARSP